MSLETRLEALSTRIAAECKSIWTAVNGKAATVHGHVLTDANVTGTLATSKGGTGTASAPALGTITYGASATTLAHLPAGTTNYFLKSNGAAAPSWVENDLDSAMPQIMYKRSCRVGTTAAIAVTTATATVLTLTAALTVLDGITLVVNDRILVKDQAAPAQNGIYLYTNSTTLTRAPDADVSGDIENCVVGIGLGSTNTADIWHTTFKSTDTLGTTAMPWYRMLDGTLLATSAQTTAGLVVQANDTRLTNARTPTTHSHAIADLPVATSGTSNTTQVVRADDSRLSNARTPTTHSHAIADLPVATSGTSNTTQVVRADDSRLSNARTPTTHTHVATTDLTATGTKNSTTFLRGDDTWGVPPGLADPIMSQAEAENNASTVARLTTGQRLYQAIDFHAPRKIDLASTGATAAYTRVAYMDGQGASSGAHVTLLVSNQGNYGSTNRCTSLIQVTQRGTNGYGFHHDRFGVSSAGWTWYVVVSGFIVEVWALRPTYDNGTVMVLSDNMGGIDTTIASQAGAPANLIAQPVPASVGDAVVRVVHGSTAATARPAATYVEWLGSVSPTNATANDTWVNTG